MVRKQVDGLPEGHDLRPAAPAPSRTTLRQGCDNPGALARMSADSGLERRVASRRNTPEACGVEGILLAETD